jgi:polysaccharide biosynthesis protein PelF
MSKKLKVMLTTEGTYPFHQGGVSTWCDTLVKDLKEVEYVIYGVTMDPFVTQKFKLAKKNQLIRMPLWGTEEPSEHLTTPFSRVYLQKKRTLLKPIEEEFIPLIVQLIEEFISIKKDPASLGQILLQLHKYFMRYEYKVSFKSQRTWETFKKIMLRYANQSDLQLAMPNVYDLIQSMGWVYRFMNILNTPVPKTDLSHASAAAFCGIPCVLAKLAYNTPFLLTEHGVYLREQYLSLSKRNLSPYLDTFLIRMVQSITQLNYFFADQVSPVCQYNTRWEKRFGVPQDKIQVIYNGVDKQVFTEATKVKNIHPTVVTVARIDPIKDLITLIKAAVIVKEQIPDVRFIVYGSVSVPDYFGECKSFIDKLKLGDTFQFAGHTSNIAQAYQSGDIVALTSISEAFPYSVVEAMMTGKAVISTNVGGISEALGDTGLLVTPRDEKGLAEGLIHLLSKPNLCEAMGRDARERALSYFTLDRVLDFHLQSYLRLAGQGQQKIQPIDRIVVPLPSEAKLFAEKAYALVANGFYQVAIGQFRAAIQADPTAVAVPIYLSEIAQIYFRLGINDLAVLEWEKAKLLIQLNRSTTQITA